MKLLRIISVFGLLLTSAAITGCWMAESVAFSGIYAHISLNDKGEVKAEYWPTIEAESDLRRDAYYIRGITVTPDSCFNGQCDVPVWRLDSDAANNWLNTKDRAGLVPLPDNITYGEEIAGMTTVYAAEPLLLEQSYQLVIGVMALDDDSDDRLLFAIQGKFSLTEELDGTLRVRYFHPDIM